MSWIGVGIATAVGGTGAIMAGQASTKRQNAKILDDQTKASGAEFDTRNQLAKDIFAENSTISKDTYDQMATLSDQEFAKRTGLSKDAFNALTRTQQDQVARDFSSAQANVDTTKGARIGRDTTVDAATGVRDSSYDDAIRTRQVAQDAARAKYESDLATANGRQDQFRGQGDKVAGDLVAAFTPEAMAARRTSATAARDALVAGTRTATPSAASATADDSVRAAFAKYSNQGVARAADTAAVGSNLAGYTDAVAGGDRVIDQGNERTGFIKDAAGRALAPLSAVLDASSIGFNNAAATGASQINNINARYGDVRTAANARYTGQTGNADADLSAALGLSGTRAAGEAKATTGYTGAMDDAYNAFFGGRQSSVGGHGDALIGANNTRLQGSNAVSSNLEGNLAGISGFRMNNTSSPWTTLGQFASAVAPTLTNMGQRNAFNKAANPVVNT